LRGLRQEDQRSGLSGARLSALSVLVFGGGPATLGQLAAAEQVSAPTITRMVAGMEREGLVRRARDGADGRVIWIHATARGRSILRRARERRIERLQAQLESLQGAELRQLEAALEVLERVAAG
jgi:DNA-binding MarR family transcriptional regulator